MRPVEQTRNLLRLQPNPRGRRGRHCARVSNALRPVQAFAFPLLRIDAANISLLEVFHGHLNRRRFDRLLVKVAAEVQGCPTSATRCRPAGSCWILYSGGNASAEKAGGGANPAASLLDHTSPSPSGKPAIRLKF